MAGKVADFSGWATKTGLKCADGRTIMHNAFAEQDGLEVPLVWQHLHDDPTNVLGHVFLWNRPEGVYCEGYFNDSAKAQTAKIAVKHGDVKSLSIFANGLVEKAKQVIHGKIREVSLVLAGANPGALIDNIAIQHGDGGEQIIEDEAVIYSGVALQHDDVTDPDGDGDDDTSPAGDTDGDTDFDPQEVWDSMTPSQKALTEMMLEAQGATHSDTEPDSEETNEDAEGDDTPGDDPGTETDGPADPDSSTDTDTNEGDDTLGHQEGTEMGHNVFDQTNKKSDEDKYSLSHDDIKSIFKNAPSLGGLKASVEDFAIKHGIDDIETLFPEARNVSQTPDFLQRRTAWVASVLDNTRHTPFSRIKSLMADITLDEARAKGYVKGNMKREEFFRVSRRITTPQTIYKKQKLDRDDILDISDFDVVVWLKAELRLMLEEELARAILMGDGRSAGDEDKIKDPGGIGDGVGIRSIANDADLYATTVYVNISADNSNWEDVVDQLVLERINYRGSGNPVLYTTEIAFARMLLIKDSLGRRIYQTKADLAAALQVSDIIPVEAMNSNTEDLLGIMVNLQDYTVGTDAGGDLNMFDFFDIDYNQYKYLLETRCSGALTKPKSALVLRATASSNTFAEPAAPTFNGTDTVTIPTDANSVYTNGDTGATLAQGSTVTLDADNKYVTVVASPVEGKYFSTDAKEWTYTFED